jgi:hypothetical protein
MDTPLPLQKPRLTPHTHPERSLLRLGTLQLMDRNGTGVLYRSIHLQLPFKQILLLAVIVETFLSMRLFSCAI